MLMMIGHLSTWRKIIWPTIIQLLDSSNDKNEAYEGLYILPREVELASPIVFDNVWKNEYEIVIKCMVKILPYEWLVLCLLLGILSSQYHESLLMNLHPPLALYLHMNKWHILQKFITCGILVQGN